MDSVTAQGATVPVVGLGTWQMSGEACREAVRSAVELGYRHVDTAQMYANETAVGQGIEDAGVDREDVFVVSKLNRGNLTADRVRATGVASADRLGGWIDLLLIHAPSRRVPIEETIGAMNDLQDDGPVRHIGVSNFSVEQLRAAIQASDRPVVTNQVEYHPYTSQAALLEYCIEHDVILTAYSPLARGRVARDETLERIGRGYGKTPAQVALRWLLQQHRVTVIPKAASNAHQAENLDIFDFQLTNQEMTRIFEIRAGLLGRLRSLLDL